MNGARELGGDFEASRVHFARIHAGEARKLGGVRRDDGGTSLQQGAECGGVAGERREAVRVEHDGAAPLVQQTLGERACGGTEAESGTHEQDARPVVECVELLVALRPARGHRRGLGRLHRRDALSGHHQLHHADAAAHRAARRENHGPCHTVTASHDCEPLSSSLVRRRENRRHGVAHHGGVHERHCIARVRRTRREADVGYCDRTGRVAIHEQPTLHCAERHREMRAHMDAGRLARGGVDAAGDVERHHARAGAIVRAQKVDAPDGLGNRAVRRSMSTGAKQAVDDHAL